MKLSNTLISQFAKMQNEKPKEKKETILKGTVVIDDRTFVKLDGSELLTPVSTTVEVKDEDRVTVTIEGHTAIITGNLTDNSAGGKKVSELDRQINEFGTVVAKKVDTEDLEAERARIDELVAEDVKINGQLTAQTGTIESLTASVVNVTQLITAANAEIKNLKTDKLDAETADITYAKVEDLEATNIKVNNIEGNYAEFESTTTDKLEAVDAVIKDLDVEKLDASFANFGSVDIDKAKVRELYVQSGLINDLFVEDATVSGYLIGVKIKGDLIEGNTIIADKLLIKGDDGLYYALNMNGETVETEQTEYNSINGSIITAESITANKIKVSDLAAFRATIGGFKITDNAIHTVTKESVDSSIQGIYLDNDGQMALGDNDSYIRYYKTTDDSGAEVYKLEISAESLKFGDGSKTSAEDLKTLTEHVKIGEWEDESGNKRPCVELAEGDSDFKQRITNIKTEFLDGDTARTTIDSSGVTTENMTVEKSFNHSGFVWAKRANGNYGLSWKG